MTFDTARERSRNALCSETLVTTYCLIESTIPPSITEVAISKIQNVLIWPPDIDSTSFSMSHGSNNARKDEITANRLVATIGAFLSSTSRANRYIESCL